MEPTTAGPRKVELWKRTLGADVQAMDALAEESRENFFNNPITHIISAVVTVIGSVLWLLAILGNLTEGHLQNAAIFGCSYLAFMSLVTVYFRFLSRMEKRQDYLLDTLRELKEQGAAQRLAETIRKAAKKGLLPTGELLAWADLVENRGAGNLVRIRLEDSLALAELNQSMSNALRDMRPGAPLALKGENSELLHRAAASMGEHDLDAIADDIRNPKGKTL